jgi:hypothetical protein
MPSSALRSEFSDALKKAFVSGKLSFHGQLEFLGDPKAFQSFLRLLFRQDWVVYAKPPFGGPEQVLHDLGAYTHRIAISNHRLVSLTDGKVTFWWRDSAHKNKRRLMTLDAVEFLRRFLLHVLPRGFVRIRHFGFLSSRRRGTLLPVCKKLLSDAPVSICSPSSAAPAQAPLWTCPCCGGPMVIVERMSARQMSLRSPPYANVAHSV